MPNYGHLSLSCAFIERPSLLDKPFCKVRFFAQVHSRKYRQKVTVITLFQTAFHRVFQLLAQTAHVCFRGRKRVTHSAFGEGSHTAAHTPKQGRFGRGWYHYLRTVPHVSETLRGRGLKRQTLPLLGPGGGALEERRKPSEQRCAHARRCSEASRPRWAA